jgi:predicted phosphate transport protein (TIGR00153 family)
LTALPHSKQWGRVGPRLARWIVDAYPTIVWVVAVATVVRRRRGLTPQFIARLRELVRPREREFFDLFERAGANVECTAGLLTEMLHGDSMQTVLARDILSCEQEGDQITAEIIGALNRSAVTPLDREDIHSLAVALDDIVDYIDEVADYMLIYRITTPTDKAVRLADVLRDASHEVADAMSRLRGFNDVSRCTTAIERLESEADEIAREAFASLFKGGGDVMTVIRWRDIYKRLEGAIDATERAGNIVSGLALKNA